MDAGVRAGRRRGIDVGWLTGSVCCFGVVDGRWFGLGSVGIGFGNLILVVPPFVCRNGGFSRPFGERSVRMEDMRNGRVKRGSDWNWKLM